MKLLLFDIDGTLIDPYGAGSRSAGKAFEDLFHIKDAFSGVHMAGKTDIQIMKEGLAAHGLPDGDETLSSIFEIYLGHLKKEIRNKRGKIKPGVMMLLDDLKEDDNCALGLLTGNIQAGARIKLEAFGLNRYFPTGAFGDDNEDRNKLIPFAVRRFKEITGIPISYGDCIIIGDTPMDVMCSRPFGAKAVAVSTGPYSYDSLVEAGADFVVEDLTVAREILKKEIEG
jgi:phosphoglycolate phosphatase-like HAD superfamily hydrolase